MRDTAGEFEVYNFTVDDFHTYFVGKNGILVHNCPDDLWNKSTKKKGMEGVRDAAKGESALDNFEKLMNESGVKDYGSIGDKGFSFVKGDTKVIVRMSKNGKSNGKFMDTIEIQKKNSRGKWNSDKEIRFDTK